MPTVRKNSSNKIYLSSNIYRATTIEALKLNVELHFKLVETCQSLVKACPKLEKQLKVALFGNLNSDNLQKLRHPSFLTYSFFGEPVLGKSSAI